MYTDVSIVYIEPNRSDLRVFSYMYITMYQWETMSSYMAIQWDTMQ